MAGSDGMSPAFSVVIPTYNRSGLLRLAVESVLAQTLGDLEVVVSDNHSTDDTREVVAAFSDPRVRYVTPPDHMVLPDHWEFARAHATGRLVMELSDDDALLTTALERFDDANRELGADFLLCTMAEYRDHGFPAERANTLEVPPFTTRTERTDAADFIKALMAFRPRFNTHPSGYVFERRLADAIAARNDGRFFQTLGVEYFAWPVAAACARAMAYIDTPLVVIGRTEKSWGTNMVLTNPGRQKIDTFISDAVTSRKYTPLTNFTFNNLAIEGLLTAKASFPAELDPFPIDYGAYVRATREELDRREALGVDVSAERAELDEYVASTPVLAAPAPPPPRASRARVIGSRIKHAPSRFSRYRERPRYLGRGDVDGFHDAATAARFLERRIGVPTLMRS